jgi:hypothetical protein
MAAAALPVRQGKIKKNGDIGIAPAFLLDPAVFVEEGRCGPHLLVCSRATIT